jgi:hypothetical protein
LLFLGDGLSVIPNPYGQAMLVQRPARDRQHGFDCIQLTGFQAVAVDGEKQADRQKDRTLIAVHERMVFRHTESIGSREVRDRALSVVGMQVLGTGQRGIEQPLIAQTAHAAELRNAFLVEQ